MLDIEQSDWRYEQEPNGTWTVWTKDTEDIGDGGEPVGEIVAAEIQSEAIAELIVSAQAMRKMLRQVLDGFEDRSAVLSRLD